MTRSMKETEPTLASILTDGMTAKNVGAYQIVADKLGYLAEQDTGKKILGTRPDKKLHAGKVFDTLNALAEQDNEGNWVLKDGAKAIIPNVNQENLQDVVNLLDQVQKLLTSKHGAGLPIKDVKQAKKKSDDLSTMIQIKGFILNLTDPKKQEVAFKIANKIMNVDGISQQSMKAATTEFDLDKLKREKADLKINERIKNEVNDGLDPVQKAGKKNQIKEEVDKEFENEFNIFDGIKKTIYDSLPEKQGIPLTTYQEGINGIVNEMYPPEKFDKLIASYEGDKKTIAQEVLDTITANLQKNQSLTVGARPILEAGKGTANKTIIESLRVEYQDQPDKRNVLEDIVRTLPPEGIKSDGISKKFIQQTSNKLRVPVLARDAAIVESSDDEREAIYGEVSVLPPTTPSTPTKTAKDTAVVETESVSGDKSIDMWKPDPSEFLAKCGLGKNEGSVGLVAPAPEASPKEKLKQAAMWYYTSAASCFNDKGFPQKAYEENFENFQNYANDVFVNQFGLTQNDANNLFSWSGASAPGVSEPKQDTVSGVKVSTDEKKDVKPEDMTRIKNEVRAELMTIPGVVTRKTGTFRPTENTNLMPRVVDARMMETFMKPKGLSGAVIGARRFGGKPGSLEGNKFTVAPGRGRANELFGTMSWHKGKGTGKTLVQAAVAMGLFNKTGSKVKFTLTGNAKELQNKFSAILDEMERYGLPLDKCQFNFPGKKSCNNIEQLKQALLDPNHPLSKATLGRNRLLMRIQSMENKIKNRSSGTATPNISMADCTLSKIMSRNLKDGLSEKNKQQITEALKDKNADEVIGAVVDKIPKEPKEEADRQKSELLEVIIAANVDPSSARQLMGADITGSMSAYESIIKNVDKIETIAERFGLKDTLKNAAEGLIERASIENMDPSKGDRIWMQREKNIDGLFKYSRDMRVTKTFVDAKTLMATQESGQRHIAQLDSKINQLQKEIATLQEDIRQGPISDLNSYRVHQISNKEAELASLQKSQLQALSSVTRSVQPLEYVAPRMRGFPVDEKVAALQAADTTNRKLMMEGGIELPGLKAESARLNDEIEKVRNSSNISQRIFGNTKLQVLENQKQIVDKKITLYETAAINVANIKAFVDASPQTKNLDDRKQTKEELTKVAQRYAKEKDIGAAVDIKKVEGPAATIAIKQNKDPSKVTIEITAKNKDTNNTEQKTIQVNKNDNAKTLEQSIKEAVQSANGAAITNSPNVWEALQRMVVDSDKKSGQDLGAIPIYSETFLSENDGLVTIAEKYDASDVQNKQAMDRALRVDHQSTVVSNNDLGRVRATRTTLLGEQINEKNTTFKEAMTSLQGKANDLAKRTKALAATGGAAASAVAIAKQNPQPN